MNFFVFLKDSDSSSARTRWQRVWPFFYFFAPPPAELSFLDFFPLVLFPCHSFISTHFVLSLSFCFHCCWIQMASVLKLTRACLPLILPRSWLTCPFDRTDRGNLGKLNNYIFKYMDILQPHRKHDPSSSHCPHIFILKNCKATSHIDQLVHDVDFLWCFLFTPVRLCSTLDGSVLTNLTFDFQVLQKATCWARTWFISVYCSGIALAGHRPDVS